MNRLIDTIVNEWSSKIDSGIIDLKNEEHKLYLLQVLNENIETPIVIDELMRALYDNKWEKIIEDTIGMHVRSEIWNWRNFENHKEYIYRLEWQGISLKNNLTTKWAFDVI